MTGVHLGEDSVQCHSVHIFVVFVQMFVALHATKSMIRRKGVVYHFFIHRAFLNGNACGKTVYYSNWLA